MSVQITKEVLSRALPSSVGSSVKSSLLKALNNLQIDPDTADIVKENFLSYTGVLSSGRYKAEDYLNAVHYVTYKLMGYSNIDSYVRVFPNRYNRLIAKGTSDKDIAAYVSAYNKNKLVNKILEQSLIPTWILNQDLYQKAINTQAEIMSNDKMSSMARVQAANSILTHLKKPDAVGPLINIDARETTGMKELKGLLVKLAGEQKRLISNGVTAKEIAEQKIIDGSVNE